MTAAVTFADKALPLAAHGRGAFPCNPRTKAPLVAGGMHAATTNPEQIKAWSHRWPDALVGMLVTGSVFVLDVDTGPAHADGFATLAERGWEAPVTRCHHTRSGGRHYWLRAPDDQPVGSTAGKLGPGLDTRGGGSGYVIRWDREGLPVENPDIIADAPDWLLTALIDADSPKLPAAPAGVGTVDNSALWAGHYPVLTQARVISLLAAIDPDCPYDDWLRVGLSLHRELGDEGLRYWAAWSSRGEKYPGPGLLVRKWQSFTGRPGAVVTAGTLVAMAHTNKKELAHVG